MARLKIARTVVKTFCECQYIGQNNDKQEAEIVLYGDYDIETAQRACKKVLNAKGCIVTNVKHESFYGSMSLEKFANECEKTNHKEW